MILAQQKNQKRQVLFKNLHAMTLTVADLHAYHQTLTCTSNYEEPEAGITSEYALQ